MTPEKLFAELLGLRLKWRVSECVFLEDRSQVDLQIEHTDEFWKLERCPQCGAQAKGYDRTEPLRWRHLNVMQYRCEIVAPAASGTLATKRPSVLSLTTRSKPNSSLSAGSSRKRCTWTKRRPSHKRVRPKLVSTS